MKLKISTSLLLLFLISSTAKSQDTVSTKQPPKWDIGLEGMLGFSVGNDFYAFNVGGPSLQFVINKDWRIGVGALPSFYVLNGKTGARLGVSPRVDYKNFVFIVPFFHKDTTDEWIWSVGLGYKFHKKK